MLPLLLQDPMLPGSGGVLDLVGSGTQSVGMIVVVVIFVRYLSKRDEQHTTVIEKVTQALNRQQDALSKQEQALDGLFREVRQTREEARCRATQTFGKHIE